MDAKETDFADGGHRRHGLCQPPGTFEGLRPTGSRDPRARLKKNRRLLAPYEAMPGLNIVWGDLTDYGAVLRCVNNGDVLLHVAAFVSPAADYDPKRAMKINYGSTRNLIRAIYELGQQERTRFVYIGTVAQTGDRMPPIHWGRVGDPIKPSMFDYYAVSKVAAERLVIESGLKYWVSLRQTGIIGMAMSRIEDAIMFHNCFDNVLEYCSDRDSARAMKNLCAYFRDGTLEECLWGHIYNIGGAQVAEPAPMKCTERFTAPSA